MRSKRSRHGMETVVSPALSRGLSRGDLIKQYFFEGYQYSVIICFLYFVHGIRLSVRQLKRVLRCMNLRRRVHPSSHYHRTVRSLIQVSNPWPFVCLLLLLHWVPLRTYCVYYFNIERAQGLRKFVGLQGNVEAIIAEVQCDSVKVS